MFYKDVRFAERREGWKAGTTTVELHTKNSMIRVLLGWDGSSATLNVIVVVFKFQIPGKEEQVGLDDIITQSLGRTKQDPKL